MVPVLDLTIQYESNTSRGLRFPETLPEIVCILRGVRTISAQRLYGFNMFF